MESVEQIKVILTSGLKRAGVRRAGLFGSFVRGEGSKESDIDVLVEFGRKETLFDLVALKEELERVLGRKVDLITYRSLSPLLRSKVLREQMSLL